MIYYSFILFTLAVVALGAYALYEWLEKNTNSRKRELEALEKKLFEEKTRMLLLRDSLLEQERERISGELHDDILQRMTALHLLTLRLHLHHAMNDALHDELQAMATEQRHIIDSLRLTVTGLRGYVLHDKTLVEGIAHLCETLNKSIHQKVVFTHVMEEWEKPMNEFVKATLYHAVQELIQNAYRHARAWRILVTVQWRSQDLLVEISDNGDGFELDWGKNQSGLRSTRNRCEAIGATLTIDTKPRSGTKATLIMPYPAMISRAVENIPLPAPLTAS
ncbi:MAG: histidine kinase [Cyclobacteriaceae bacterium]|jgi:signal transduction histidine kinase|nr:histidine kinase [Cyclobacteriaceae bacterium]